MRWRTVLIACLSILVVTSCSGGVTDSTTPPIKPDSTPTNPGGTVQRTSLTVRVQIDPADAAIASTTGISIAGQTVRLTKSGSNAAPLVAATDATGTVKFESLLDGVYTASVERVLTATEIARLSPSDRDATVFAGGVTAVVSPPNAQTSTISLVGSRRGSLVISEVFAYWGFPVPYNWGSYIEVYNNGDTTAYLDGMYVASTTWLVLHTDGFANCDVPAYLPYRSDTSRIWVQAGLKFPGAGQQYPVPPGEARVYAADALDHRSASGSSSFPDLSGAQFEQVGSEADIDNPTAANMVRAFNNTGGPNGRGLRVTQGAWLLIRASAASQFRADTLQPFNTQSSGGIPFAPQPLWGVPKDDVVDLISLDYSPDFKAYLFTTTFRYELCQPFLPSVFERSPAELFDATYRPGAIRRRSLGQTPDGREILMRTRTSARDLEVTTSLLRRSLNK